MKHGCREATIEIELQRSPEARRNPIVTRVIKREGNKSEFSLNGNKSAAGAIRSLANRFSIQIDNLCQFLPQDRVVEFAQMSPIELLTSTQRAVAGSDLTKMHDDLKAIRSKQISAMGDSKNDREHLANLESRQEMQSTEVDQMRKRAEVQKKLDRLERCRPLTHYLTAKTNYLDAKAKVKALSQELKHLKAAEAPTLKRLDSKKEYEKTAKSIRSSREQALAASVRNSEEKAKAIGTHQDALSGIENRIAIEKRGIPENKEVIRKTQVKILELKRKKAEKPEDFDPRAINDEIQQLKNQQRALKDQKDEMQSRQAELRGQGTSRNKQLRSLNHQLEGLETHAGQQETKLEQLSRDTFRAWKWIQENRNLFTQHVYGPPMVECTLKDPQMADALEALLQENDFKIITVQNKADFSLLQRKLFQEQKLHDISLRECNSDNLDQFRSPLAPEELQRFGLNDWALGHLQGPTTVLAMLCQERSLHRAALSLRELSQQQHDDLEQTTVQSYVAGRKHYQFLRRAEYGSAGTSTRVRDVRNAKWWTNQPIDMGRKADLQRQINELKDDLKTIKSEFDNVGEQIEELGKNVKRIEQNLQEKRDEKEAKQQARSEWLALDAKISESEDRIKKAREALRGVNSMIADLNEQYDAALLAKTEAVLQFASSVKDVKLKTANLLEAEVIHIEALSDHQVLQFQSNHITQSIADKAAEKAVAENVYRQEHERASRIRDIVFDLKAEVYNLAEQGDRTFLQIFEYVSSEIRTEENLDEEIDAAKANLALSEGGRDSIIKEYEDRAKLIEKLRTKLEDAETRQGEFAHGIQEIRSRWEPRLEEIVARINDAFSDSFARIGCAGQVAIHKASSDDPADCTEDNGGADNGLDFAHWAIHISVKFREQEPLSLLDSHRQSGGERAVSTIFYLMAMQSLSRAPFRVVDEINQGMDPRNERMVHGRMVDIAADDGGSQYFLITPKLLSGLKYRRGMTVLCIVSGENMPAAREQDDEGNWDEGPKVDFRTIVQKAKALGWGTASDGRRVDSGVGIGRALESGRASRLATIGA